MSVSYKEQRGSELVFEVTSDTSLNALNELFEQFNKKDPGRPATISNRFFGFSACIVATEDKPAEVLVDAEKLTDAIKSQPDFGIALNSLLEGQNIKNILSLSGR